MSKRTIVYVDAFNLYHGALRKTRFKWLDILALSKAMIDPKYDIIGIKYFTAKVLPRPNDPGAPTRQDIYIRALKTLGTEVVLGHFLTHRVRMFRADQTTGTDPFVEVIKTEEKGSDVNLASHLLLDAMRDRIDCGVLITGDSDLKTPVILAQKEFGKIIGVINPQKKDCQTLRANATFYARIRRNVLAASQFPDVLKDKNGVFRKPSKWY